MGTSIAALIVEPVAGNMGLVLPQKKFLNALRHITKKFGTVLIFDEVITGFRLAYGGAQEHYGVRPDLTCLGKIIGGGFPVGALGGNKKIMDHLAPLGPVYQAGTLSGNPVAMTAGLATLKILKKLNPYAQLEKRTNLFVSCLRSEIKKLNLPLQIQSMGSAFTLFFTHQPVTDFRSAQSSNTKMFARFYQMLLRSGIYFPPSQFETAFISCAHNEIILQRAVKKIIENLNQLSQEERV